MKILIVDDEKLATSRVERLLQEQNCVPEINGLDLANKIMQKEPSTFIIFQTAYHEFTMDAFKVGGVDYILKPTTKENILGALLKVESFMKSSGTINIRKIIGKSGDKIHLMDIDDIFYIKADLDEVIIKIEKTQCYVRKKIGDMAQLLKNKNFFRVHRSFIVNIDKIKSMKSIEQSKLEISFCGIDDIITSSKDGAKDFREYMERNSL